ncbi:MAG: carboxypeptidase-like regulatory domain-containing protein [Fusobacteriota bacterium]
MKKIFFVLYIIILIPVFSNTITGEISVEDSGNYGVFVYIEEALKYDITDVNGRFKIDGLEADKEYTLVCQKSDFPNYETKVTTDLNPKEISINLRKTSFFEKYLIRGVIESENSEDIFLNFKEKGYGLIVKPNDYFRRELEAGDYKASLRQKGSQTKEIRFQVEKKDINNIGSFILKPIETNSLELLFDKESDRKINGYTYLYKDGDLHDIKKIDSKNRLVTFKNLPKDIYKIETKIYGYKDIQKKIKVSGLKKEYIKLNSLDITNKIEINIIPEDIKSNITLYHDNIKIKEVKEVIGNYTFERLYPNKIYKLEVSSPKYKTETLRLKTGESKDINLIRNITGAILEGNISPFTKDVDVMLLGEEDILGKTKTDEDGHFKIEISDIKPGTKKLRIMKEGFFEKNININIKKGDYKKDINIQLEPVINAVYGKVKLANKKAPKGALAIIKELNIWTRVGLNGNYYFKDIPNGKYTVIYQKFGYETEARKVNIKSEAQEINVDLHPKGNIIINSNIKDYTLIINGKSREIDEKVYNLKLDTGVINLIAQKEGYLIYKNQVELLEPGQKRELTIDFTSISDHKLRLEYQLNEIKKLIERLEIRKAEKRIYEISKLRYIKSYETELKKLKRELNQAKNKLYELDREIENTIREYKKKIKDLKNRDISYGQKRDLLNETIQKAIDYLNGILKKDQYTTMEYDIYKYLGELYFELGMVNISDTNFKRAKALKEN